jgi:DNA gyrase/topoisomerase IV subunit A
MMITDGGTIIRTPVKDIPSYSRAASGVIVMRLDEGRSLVNFALCPNEEEAEEQAAAANANISAEEINVDPSEIHVPDDVVDADSDFE